MFSSDSFSTDTFSVDSFSFGITVIPANIDRTLYPQLNNRTNTPSYDGLMSIIDIDQLLAVHSNIRTENADIRGAISTDARYSMSVQQNNTSIDIDDDRTIETFGNNRTMTPSR